MLQNNLSPEIRQKINRWITCFALVGFDVNEGQKVEYIVPELKLSKVHEKEIAMLSFPDSNTVSENQNTYKYTFKSHNGLFGYVCFKQKKDEKNDRGFSQKSLVICTQLPFVYFFEKMAEFIVFKTFNTNCITQIQQTLYSIALQISQWPDPTPKSAYTLPILQYSLQIHIPNFQFIKGAKHDLYNQKKQEELRKQLNQGNKDYNLKNILYQQQMLKNGPFQQIQLAHIFSNCKEGLWTLWECMMLNKSVLLLGENPQQVSHAVLGGISLMYPFEYCGYFNPYITVYDPNLDQISKQNKNWLIGGTNPVFQKYFKPQITVQIPLHASMRAFKSPKHLKPLKDLVLNSNSEEQQAINQAAIHKYFYQLSLSVLSILDSYLNKQQNNLKLFNSQQFMKMIKDKKDFLGLQNIYSSKKYVIAFFENFITTLNFDKYLHQNNACRIKL